MKKVQVLGLSLILAIGLSGCFEKAEDKDREESLKVWKEIDKKVAQIKKERAEQVQKPKTETQKKLDNWYKEKSEAGKKSKAYQILDLNSK